MGILVGLTRQNTEISINPNYPLSTIKRALRNSLKDVGTRTPGGGVSVDGGVCNYNTTVRAQPGQLGLRKLATTDYCRPIGKSCDIFATRNPTDGRTLRT